MISLRSSSRRHPCPGHPDKCQPCKLNFVCFAFVNCLVLCHGPKQLAKSSTLRVFWGGASSFYLQGLLRTVEVLNVQRQPHPPLPSSAGATHTACIALHDHSCAGTGMCYRLCMLYMPAVRWPKVTCWNLRWDFCPRPISAAPDAGHQRLWPHVAPL